MRKNELKKMRKATGLLKCMSHPLRLSLLCHLSAKKEMSAGDLVELEKKSGGQSQISQYLGQLRRLGLVKTRRRGQMIYYRLTSPAVKKMLRLLFRMYCGKR